MSRNVFIDAAFEAAYRRDGYVRVPLLDPAQVQHFRELFDSFPCECPQEFYTSLWSENEEYRRRVHDDVRENLEPLIAPVMNDYRVVLGNFAVKQASEASSVPMHQDWSFVDERQYRSLTVWCPLIDVDSVNGCLQVIPRSHRYMDNIRPNFADGAYYSLFAEQEPLLRERHLLEIPMSAGEAVIYDSGLLHASNPNRSGAVRVAMVGTVVPRSAPLRHYFQTVPDEIEVFDVAEDFYWREVKLSHKPVSSLRLGAIRAGYPNLTAQRIAAVMDEA